MMHYDEDNNDSDDNEYDGEVDDDNDHSDDDIVGAIIFRFILMPPGECNNIDLYPKSHPSARHSQLNWTDIDYLRSDRKFYASRAIETIVSTGELLYIPSYWIHYIISQDASIQCNARCGESELGTH